MIIINDGVDITASLVHDSSSAAEALQIVCIILLCLQSDAVATALQMNLALVPAQLLAVLADPELAPMGWLLLWGPFSSLQASFKDTQPHQQTSQGTAGSERHIMRRIAEIFPFSCCTSTVCRS